MSAGTLFAGNYYGKLSLDESVEDHERMISLLLAAQNQIDRGKQSETVLKALAYEELGENAFWYAYQKANSPEIGL